MIREIREIREISDAIVSFAPRTLERLPVRRTDAVRQFVAIGDAVAARYIEALPEDGAGYLDPAAVDRVLLQSHCEMQRISEEFLHGRRVADIVLPFLSILPTPGCARRVVDIGCGTGYVIRALAASGRFGDDTELMGIDFNPALIAAAQEAAEAEGLRCTFAVANAFTLNPPADVYLSTGILHHFPAAALPTFFAEQKAAGASAFFHFDFQPSVFAPAGSWLFHELRTRSVLSRHDGLASARRVHTGETLLRAAREGAAGMATALYGRHLSPRFPVPRVFQTVLGVRADLRERFTAALGRRAERLEGWDA